MTETKKILAIESSCDETSFAVLEASGGLAAPKITLLHHLITSQIAVHRPFGGVVPNLAKREHLKNLPFLYNELRAKGFDIRTMDLVAVTVGPGLEPALWTGINFAKALAAAYKKPILGVNHLEGHLYSFLFSDAAQTRSFPLLFPAIGLIVSGGHTMLLRMPSLETWKIIGSTLDDAAGEAYDKVARLLSLPYPGGPELEKLAKKGNAAAIAFPRPMLNRKNYDFSFSGLKTAVLYHLKKQEKLSARMKADVAAAFQEAVIDVLVKKTERALAAYGGKALILAGGVAGNRSLRNELAALAKKEHIPFFVPGNAMNTDNAAMIGAAAYIHTLRRKRSYPLKANGNLSL